MASRRSRATIDRLGHRGTVRVLDDLLDQNHLVRLANAVGIRYPGLRNRSQKRPVLLADLAQKALVEREARTAVLKSLDKRVAAARKAWKKLDDEAKQNKLSDLNPNSADRSFGTHLFLLADESNGTDEILAGWLEAPLSKTESEDTAELSAELKKTQRALERTEKRYEDLEIKLEHTESQLKRHRDAEKELKKKLNELKSELAAEQKKSKTAQTQATKSSAGKASASGKAELEALRRAIRQLGTQQRKWKHELTRIQEMLPNEESTAQAMEAGQMLEILKKERAALRREKNRFEKEEQSRLDSLAREVKLLKRKVTPPPPPKPKVATERVGIFIDVQNVYYGARQLKGKLDFEALLETARQDRKLVQSRAYVVESRERDQTAFLSLLSKLDIDVRKKPVKVRSDGSMKGDWDMEIALDMLDAAPKLDVVVLVSGDGDFTSLVHRLRASSTRVEILSFPKTTAKALIEAADQYTPLDRKFMIRSGR